MKTCKQLISVLSFSLAVIALLSGHAWSGEEGATGSGRKGDVVTAIKAAGKIRVAQAGIDYPPFFFKKKVNGVETWVGFEMDLGQLVADRLGVKLEVIHLGENFNETCEYVGDGRADIAISNLSDTPERRKIADFTIPYLVSRVGMLVNLEALEKDGIDAIEPSDLNNSAVKISVSKGSYYEEIVDEQFPKAKKVYVPNGAFDDVAVSILKGESHALIDDGLQLNLGMSNNPELSSKYFFHIFSEYDDPLSICLPKNQPEFLDFLNGIIRELEEQEPITLEYLIERYMK